jgi:uncharacterized membrane protein
MAEVRESIAVEAPAERVWDTVHQDLRNFTKWTTNVKRVQKVTPGAPGVGMVYRYTLVVPGGEQVLEIEHTEWEKPRRCSGEYVRGPVSGTWSYSYSERAGRTRVTYVSDFRLTGVLRLMTAAFLPHYRNGVRDNLRNLKQYLEGRG